MRNRATIGALGSIGPYDVPALAWAVTISMVVAAMATRQHVHSE
jgi:hypothetical protein